MNAFVWKQICRLRQEVVCQHQSQTGNWKRRCHLLRESQFYSWIQKQHIAFWALFRFGGLLSELLMPINTLPQLSCQDGDIRIWCHVWFWLIGGSSCSPRTHFPSPEDNYFRLRGKLYMDKCQSFHEDSGQDLFLSFLIKWTQKWLFDAADKDKCTYYCWWFTADQLGYLFMGIRILRYTLS